MGKESYDYLPLTLGISTLAFVSIFSIIHRVITNKEEFADGFGFTFPPSRYPIFVNLRKQNLSTDFKLRDLIQNLKYKVFKPFVINNENIYGTEKKNPIILFPDIGECKLYGKWNKPNAKTVDNIAKSNQNFEQSTNWTCRAYQDSWVPLWFPSQSDNTLIDKFCWEDNVKVIYDKNNNTLLNSPGVVTMIKNFGSTPDYMNTLVESLQSIGYHLNFNLFGADYDFRKICSKDEYTNYINEVKAMIELSVRNNNGKKAILMGHGLGANVANFLLVNQSKEWKDKYIDSFISISGSYGGCPQALRTLLSGLDNFNNSEGQLVKNAYKNFSGLLWLLPSSNVYGNTPLVYFNNTAYSINNLERLLTLDDEYETYEIYKNIVKPIQDKAMEAPGVSVYVLAGYNIPTESDYVYKDTVSNSPSLVNPYYNTYQEYQNYEDYPEKYNGDGIIPYISLEVPLKWSKSQHEPIYYRFYDRADHLSIIDLYDPVNDIINIILGKNNLDSI